MGHALSFGQLLKHYRKASGLTQEELAEQARLSVRGIQALEQGASHTPRPDTVALLAVALRLSPQAEATFAAAARPRSFPPADPSSSGGPRGAGDHAFVPLVGRAPELAVLERHLLAEQTTEGTPRVLLLSGEPGIGKSRLLQEAVQRGVAHGLTVLAGGCHRRGSQEPYVPLLDALAQHLHAQAPSRLRAALSGCAWLVRLLPELADVLEPLPAGTLAPEQERRLMFAAVARVLANVAGPAGTLLVLDDLQWAGPDALDLLAMLVRSPSPAHRERGAGESVLRVVGAYRDTEVRPADPLGLLLADLAQAGLARQCAVGPLSAEEAAGLLDNLLGGVAEEDRAMAESVLQRAGGVPFFLISYAQARQQGSVEAVPWDLAQALRQRVALLPAAGQEILGAAAIVGWRVPHAMLVAVAGASEEVVLAGVEAAHRARLLREDGDTAYVFAHDVIREVVEADMGAARRAVLHRRMAEALERTPAGASPEVLAHHYLRGGDEAKAVQYLELAGDHAWAQRAHGAAERHYRELLDRLEALGRVTDALRVREKWGEVLYRAGRFDATLQVLEPAADVFRAAGDGASAARITARIGWVHSLRGTPHEGVVRLTPLLEDLERSAASSPLAVLYEALGRLLFAVGRYGESLAASERAAELARAVGDKRTQVLADGHRLNLLQMLGRLRDALRLSQEVLPYWEATGDLDGLLRAHRDLANIHALQGDVALGRAVMERALVVAVQLGDPGQISFTLALRAWIALLGGDWQGARADLDQALALSRRVEGSHFAAYALVRLAHLSLVEGAGADARAAIQEALALAERSADLQALRWACGVMAELDMLEERPEEAAARLVPLLDRPGLEECDVTALLPALAWAYLELGQVDRATDAVGQALVRARREDMWLVVVEALRVQAVIALRQERRLERDGPQAVGDQSPRQGRRVPRHPRDQSFWDVAAHSLEEGLALARAMPYPYAEARLRHACAQMHHQRGELESARVHLEAALALFRRLGARRDAAQVDQALASLSQNPSPSQNTSPSSLEPQVTETQWAQIAALLPSRARTGRPHGPPASGRPAGPGGDPLQAAHRLRLGRPAGGTGGRSDGPPALAGVAGGGRVGADRGDHPGPCGPNGWASCGDRRPAARGGQL